MLSFPVALKVVGKKSLPVAVALTLPAGGKSFPVVLMLLVGRKPSPGPLKVDCLLHKV